MTVANPDTDTTADAIDTVAIISPGDRTDRITDGLDATQLTYAVNPATVRAYDAVICDTPDREMAKTVAAKPLHRTPVLFRMRGDPFWGLDEWVDSRAKRWLALNVMLKQVDGCIAIAPHQAKKYERKTGVDARLAALPIAPDQWPTAEHTDRDLRLLTLTNAVYPAKIEPLIAIMPTVDQVLSGVGGHWRIGSWSEGHHDRLADAAAEHDHVTFDLRLDAHDELERANCMLHFSGLDVLPNAILEGMAAGLPVVTNDHVAFTQSDAPLTICRQEEDLPRVLSRFTDPDERAQAGADGLAYVRDNHAARHVGAQFVDALAHFAGGDSR